MKIDNSSIEGWKSSNIWEQRKQFKILFRQKLLRLVVRRSSRILMLRIFFWGGGFGIVMAPPSLFVSLPFVQAETPIPDIGRIVSREHGRIPLYQG
jgi:hypothetical protein